MKTSSKSFCLFRSVLLCLTLISLLVSCKKEEVEQEVKEPKKPKVSFFNAVLQSKMLDLHFGNRIISTNGFEFGDTIAYKEFENAEYKIGVTNQNEPQLVSSDYINLKDGKSYSVFSTGIYPNIKFVKTEDNSIVGDSTKSQIRLVHLSPDAADVDLLLGEKVVGNANSVSYRDVTQFTYLEPSGEYHFKLIESQSRAILVDLRTTDIQKGKIYTIYFTGLRYDSSPENKLKLIISPNK